MYVFVWSRYIFVCIKLGIWSLVGIIVLVYGLSTPVMVVDIQASMVSEMLLLLLSLSSWFFSLFIRSFIASAVFWNTTFIIHIQYILSVQHAKELQNKTKVVSQFFVLLLVTSYFPISIYLNLLHKIEMWMNGMERGGCFHFYFSLNHSPTHFHILSMLTSIVKRVSPLYNTHIHSFLHRA